MKVLFISHGFPPARHSGTFRSEGFSHYLPDFGIYPLIVCDADDNPRVLHYARDLEWRDDPRWPEVRRIPWGMRAAGERLGPTDRLVRRVPLLWTLVVRRMRREVIQNVLVHARDVIVRHRPSVIYASSPPVECLMIAARLGAEFSLPVVQDLRDVWSYGWEARYRHYVDFLFERALERNVLRGAARVIANTPTSRSLLISKIGLSGDRVTTIPNGYDERCFESIGLSLTSSDSQFRIAYLGLLSGWAQDSGSLLQIVKRKLGFDFRPMSIDSSTRSAEWFLKAIEKIIDLDPGLRGIIRIDFVGSYSVREQEAFRAFRYADVVSVHPPVSRSESAAICCRANLLLLCQVEMILNGSKFCTATPGKLYEYLRSGTRIMGLLQQGDAQELIDRFDAGVVVVPKDIDAIAQAVCGELEQWRINGRTRITHIHPELQAFDYRHLTGQLAEVLMQVAM